MKKYFTFFVLYYLRVIAKLQIKKINPVIIGVGGSSGKTSLSNFIYVLLKSKYLVRQGKGKNSETGIPLDILRLNPKSYSYFDWLKILIMALIRFLTDFKKYDYYVAEMGIDSPIEPKNMSYLLKIIQPNVSILTNIAHEHSVYFDHLILDKDSKAREDKILDLTADQERLLLTSVDNNGFVVLNIDDENIKKAKDKIKANIFTVSVKDMKADFYIEDIKNFVDKFMLLFRFKGNKYKLTINNPLPKHFAYSFIDAIAIAKICNIEILDSIKILEKNFYLPPGRMSVFRGIKDTVIIDSSYNNATLTPIIDMLDFVKEIGTQRRRVGIIGDMRELGTISKSIHEKVANKILETLDMVILIGPLSQEYMLPILEKNKFPVFSFINLTSAKEVILEKIKPKDMILVKSSQNTLFLERVVEMLLSNPKDKEKLCRRGEYWDKIRENTL